MGFPKADPSQPVSGFNAILEALGPGVAAAMSNVGGPFASSNRKEVLEKLALATGSQSPFLSEATARRKGRAASGGGTRRAGVRASGPSRTEANPHTSNMMRERQQDRLYRKQEGRERSRLTFEAELANRVKQQQLQQIMSLIGGLPKTINSTDQEITDVAGSFVPRTRKQTKDIDYSSILSRFF